MIKEDNEKKRKKGRGKKKKEKKTGEALEGNERKNNLLFCGCEEEKKRPRRAWR
jgi:hypothetical protein